MKSIRGAHKLSEAGVERALGQLRDVLRLRGLKASGVRDSIARAALRMDGHFTVDELLGHVPGAHAATVYRILPLLVDAGLLQAAPAGTGDATYYERAFEREHHDHLLCTSCHRVVEFHFEAIEALQRDVAERFDFALTGHVHELKGVCRACRGTRKS